jgi:hypothetical protein
VRLADARGTAWRGSGLLADAKGSWRLPIGWRLDPVALLRGGLALDLDPAESAGAKGTLHAQGNTLRVEGLHVELPAAMAETLWRRPPVPRVDGTLGIDAPAFSYDGSRGDGRFELRWSNARVGLAGVRARLGTVEAHGRSADGAVVVDLSSAGGDAVLRGTATLRNDGASLVATLAPTPTLAPAAAVALRALGPADPDGTIHVTWQARR